MTWTSQPKGISIAYTKKHATTNASLVGRPPGIAAFNFSPAEFFGAAARCCYSNVINPAMVTPESEMIKSLVEQHVDNSKNNFEIESSADHFVDYAKSFFAGTVAVGLAYLTMVRDGYTWADHFKNIGGGNPGSSRTPDLVFARDQSNDVALVESKGTRSRAPNAFDTTVNDGYVNQVEPHLGYLVGTSTATHGYCIGSCLRSSQQAELRIHYTDVVAGIPSAGVGGLSGSIAAVQRHNYATAFRLAHSEQLSQQIRRGEIRSEPIRFSSFTWLGREWVTAPAVLPRLFAQDPDIALIRGRGVREVARLLEIWGGLKFAIERNCATAVLRRSSRTAVLLETEFNVALIPEEFRREADRDSSGGAAIFPDGLAVFARGVEMWEPHPLLWLPQQGKFVPDTYSGRRNRLD